MALNKLALALRHKKKEQKLSITALAEAIGANSQSVASALKGKSVPNRTTAPRFAKFLGISIEEFAKLTKGEAKPAVKGKAKSAKRSVKAKKAVKVAKVSTRPKTREITLAEAADLAADALAVATHRATAAQRRIIEAVLGL